MHVISSFVSCFLENLFLAKTSKLEMITAVAINLYRMNNSLAKVKEPKNEENEEACCFFIEFESWKNQLPHPYST